MGFLFVFKRLEEDCHGKSKLTFAATAVRVAEQ